MHLRRALSICSMALLAGGCAADGSNNREQMGAILGSKVGQGSGRTAAVAAGTLMGAWAGSEIGRSLDRTDQMYLERVTRESLEEGKSGETSTWTNPDSANSGTVTPQPAFQDSKGRYCREFQQTVTIGNTTETAYGAACRQPNGAWKIVPL